MDELNTTELDELNTTNKVACRSSLRIITNLMYVILGWAVFGEIRNNYVKGNFFMYLKNRIRLQCFKTVLGHGFAVQIVRDGHISP